MLLCVGRQSCETRDPDPEPDQTRRSGNDADAAKNPGGGGGAGGGISARRDAEPELGGVGSLKTRNGLEPALYLVDKEWSRRNIYRDQGLWFWSFSTFGFMLLTTTRDCKVLALF